MSTGEIIREKRLALGMTQAALAQAVQVDQSLICQIERGSKAISFPLAQQVAHALGCSISDLAGEEQKGA